MKRSPVGPLASEQIRRFGRVWEQGEHVLISGATGSGKTELARHVYQQRIDRGGFVVVFVMKLRPDKTILREYAKEDGWVRWKKWKKNPSPQDQKVLLWPDIDDVPASQALPIQKEVFAEAFDKLSMVGKWMAGIDEGLYLCNSEFLNMSHELAMSHAVGRSSLLTMVTLTQRPSHLPLIIYGSASHAFIGRTREAVDAKRLAELGGRESGKQLLNEIDRNSRHDFLWIPVAPDWPSERLNLRK